MSYGLENKIVIVTGANGRLGRVVCAKLAEAGAQVAAVDRSSPEGRCDYGAAADLTDASSVDTAWRAVENALGTPAAVIHTVGMWGGAPLADTDPETWETILAVNLTSAFLVFRATAQRMLANQTGGSLVGISSVQGADKGVAEQAAYSAAKAGVMRLAESAAAEYRDSGISAVVVAPTTLLFGDEPSDARGVAVEVVADLCVRFAGSDGAVHSGETVRAYGSAG